MLRRDTNQMWEIEMREKYKKEKSLKYQNFTKTGTRN